jgi:hypothetical protein
MPGLRYCPECGADTKDPQFNYTENCATCRRAEREITKLLEEMVARGEIEHAGVNEHGGIVYRRTK